MIGENVTFDSVLNEQREKLRLVKRAVPKFKHLGRTKMAIGVKHGRNEASKSYFESAFILHHFLQKLCTEDVKSDEYFEGDEVAAAKEQNFDLHYLYDHLRLLEPAPARKYRNFIISTSLSGEVLSLIDTKRITERNYDFSWQYLKTRYDNESALIWAYL